MSTLRGRYAPSPTGELHLGNASSALLAWLSVRSRGGTFVMRVEDLDRNRVRPGLAERILGDLEWLGLDWDEGPDRGGLHAPYAQSSRGDHYRVAFGKLAESGRLYACFCSRRDVAAAASAPQKPGEEVRYPGTCRGLRSDAAARRVEAGERHCWRFRVDPTDRPQFTDLVRGVQGNPSRRSLGDFVVSRADGVPAYQLAVVVDDAAMRITEVVRGDDLLASTLKQLLLFDALGVDPPVFGHVPLLLGPDGVRLSKRHRGITIGEVREAGLTAAQVVGRLARLLGLRHDARPLSSRALLDGFDLGRLPPAPGGIRIDSVRWP